MINTEKLQDISTCRYNEHSGPKPKFQDGFAQKKKMLLKNVFIAYFKLAFFCIDVLILDFIMKIQ